MYNAKWEVFIYDLWFCDHLRHFHYKQFYQRVWLEKTKPLNWKP